MENQKSSVEKINSGNENMGNAFGAHPMSQGGFADAGDAPTLRPPDFQLGSDSMQSRSGQVIQRAEDGSMEEELSNRHSSPPQESNVSSPPNEDNSGSGSGNGGSSGEGNGGGNSNNGDSGNPNPPPPVSYSESGEIQNTTSTPSAPSQPSEPTYSEGGENDLPDEVKVSDNPDLKFFGFATPLVAPSTTLKPIPISHQTKLIQTYTLANNQYSTTKDAGEKVVEAEMAAAPPENEGRKDEAEKKVNAPNADEAPTNDSDSLYANAKSKIDTFASSDSKMESFIQADGKSELAEVKTAVKDETGKAALVATTTIADHYPTDPAIPLTGEIEPAVVTPAINLGEGAWPEAIAENSDLSGILQALETEYASISAGENAGGENDGGGDSENPGGLEDIEEYQQLKLAVQTDRAAELSTELETKKSVVSGEMVQAETDRTLAMTLLREEKLRETNQKQEETKVEYEKAKITTADAVNERFDAAKTLVESTLLDLDNVLNGTTASSYSHSSLAGASNGYDQAMDWAIDQFHAEANAEFDILTVPPKKKWWHFLAPNFNGDQGGWDHAPEAVRHAKPQFDTRIEQLVIHYTGVINTAIEACNDEIGLAKLDIDALIAADPDLTAAEIARIQAPLTELTGLVQDEATGLREDLAEKKDAAVEEVDEYIASVMANPLKQLVMDILKMIGEGAEWLLLLFFKAAGIENGQEIIDAIKTAGKVIGDIIANPGRFIKTLAEAIIETFVEFFQDFGDNMQEIFMRWLGVQPDLQFPEDMNPESWVEFGLGMAGYDKPESAQDVLTALPTEFAIGDSITLDIGTAISALVNGGPGAMWEDLQSQLTNFPIVDAATSAVTVGEEGEEQQSWATPAEVLAEIQGMSWEEILVEVQAMGLAPGFDPAQLEEAKEIYGQISTGDFQGLIERFTGDLDEELKNPAAFIWAEFKTWIQTDLVAKLPEIMIQFAGGGLGKIAMAIYKGIKWMIEKRAQIADLIKGFFGIIPEAAAGNKEGAKAKLDETLKNAAGLTLSFVTEVGVGISIAGKVDNIVGKVTGKIKKSFDKIMESIGKSIDKFMKSVKDLFDKPRKKKGTGTTGNGESGTPTLERDYLGNVIQEEGLAGKIIRLKNLIDGKIDSAMLEEGTGNFTIPSYGNSYQDKAKTYNVMTGLLELYKLYDDQDPSQLSEQVLQDLADRIDDDHKVFSSFKVAKGESKASELYNVKDGVEYWAWEWTASPTKKAAASIILPSTGGNSGTLESESDYAKGKGFKKNEINYKTGFVTAPDGKGGTETEEVAVEMEAKILGPNHGEGEDTGSSESKKAAQNYINHWSPSTSGGYVRGHLLNARLGGPATKENLFPFTHQANMDHKSIESQAKKWVNSFKYYVYYKVTVVENDHPNGKAKLKCELYKLDGNYNKTGSGYKLTFLSEPNHKGGASVVSHNSGNTATAKKESSIPEDQIETGKDAAVHKSFDEEVEEQMERDYRVKPYTVTISDSNPTPRKRAQLTPLHRLVLAKALAAGGSTADSKQLQYATEFADSRFNTSSLQDVSVGAWNTLVKLVNKEYQSTWNEFVEAEPNPQGKHRDENGLKVDYIFYPNGKPTP